MPSGTSGFGHMLLLTVSSEAEGVTWIDGVDVDYRVGDTSYTRWFGAHLLFCPPVLADGECDPARAYADDIAQPGQGGE